MEASLVQKNFLLNNIPEHILSECSEYSKSFAEEEACGIILQNSDRFEFKPCENISSDKRNFFAINPAELIYDDIKYIFHSHWQGGARPSYDDKKACEELCIPFLIYSVKDNEFFLYENISV